MDRRISLCVNLAIAAVFMAAAGACLGDVKSELQAEYDKISAAFQKKDIKALMAGFAPGYTDNRVNGQTTGLKEEEASWKQNMAVSRSGSSVKVTVESASAKGGEAVATVHIIGNLVQTDNLGQLGPKGKDHKVGFDAREKDTWIKTTRGWRMKHTDDLPGAKSTLDGKPIAVPTQPAPKKL